MSSFASCSDITHLSFNSGTRGHFNTPKITNEVHV
jgi:hypothetical protein